MPNPVIGAILAACCIVAVPSSIEGGAATSGRLPDGDGSVKKYSFGTPTSATRVGFTKVTVQDEFSSEKGYGFRSTRGLEAIDRGGSKIELPKDPYTASVYGAYRTTSDITCTFIEGDGDNEFIVALPDGTYTIWVIACDAAYAPPLFEVWTDAAKKLDVRIPRERFVFMEPFEARAAEGRLRIELKGPHGWILSGLVIGPEGPELAEVIARLNRDIFFLTEEELPKWKEAKYVPIHPPLELKSDERERGYVVFPADYTVPIVPAYVPHRAEVGKPLTAFATPGEFEPVTFCVSARRELGEVAVELADFVDETSGHEIDKRNVTVGVVRCWPQRSSDWGGKGEYRVVPEMIEPPAGRARRVQAGQLKQWWLTVHVPPDSPAGRYRMSLAVRPEKAEPTTVEWRLLVLPFSLSRPADKHWGALQGSLPWEGGVYGSERRGRSLPAEIDRLSRADVADYRDHGFDLVAMNYYFGVKENPDGTFTYGLSTLSRDIEYLKALGSGAPVVVCFEYTCRELENRFAEPGKKHVPGTFSPKARRAIVGLVRAIHEEGQRRGWPKLYYFPIDEPGNNKTENRYLFAENVLDFVHEVPGCQTAVTVTADCVRRLGDRVDVRIYAYGHYTRERVLQDAGRGHPFWFYENGMFYAHSTLASRGNTGFEFLRSGAKVATAWGYAATNANPYNDFDGGHKDWNVVFPGVDGPTPTIYWELCREGVDDARYVATLQREIRKARERGAAGPAERAAKVLDPLTDPAAPRIEEPLAFGRYRWRLAREILALRGDREMAVPFVSVADNPPPPETIGSNLVENSSFEEPAQAEGLPVGRYYVGYPRMKKKPVGTVQVSDEVAHSGRFSLKWDLSKVADPEARGRDPRWVTVNVGLSSDTVRSLRGKRFKVGYWVRVGGGTTVPGLGVRQNLKEGPGDGFYYRGGVEDPSVWNHFETEGRFANDLESMDIHTWVAVPEAELARKSYFYIDDVSLQVIEEPPIMISTPLDEYRRGEDMTWTLSVTSSGQVTVSLLAGEQRVKEETSEVSPGGHRGSFPTRELAPGVYTLEAAFAGAGQTPQFSRRQVIVSPDPFDWGPSDPR